MALNEFKILFDKDLRKKNQIREKLEFLWKLPQIKKIVKHISILKNHVKEIQGVILEQYTILNDMKNSFDDIYIMVEGSIDFFQLKEPMTKTTIQQIFTSRRQEDEMIFIQNLSNLEMIWKNSIPFIQKEPSKYFLITTDKTFVIFISKKTVEMIKQELWMMEVIKKEQFFEQILKEQMIQLYKKTFLKLISILKLNKNDFLLKSEEKQDKLYFLGSGELILQKKIGTEKQSQNLFHSAKKIVFSQKNLIFLNKGIFGAIGEILEIQIPEHTLKVVSDQAVIYCLSLNDYHNLSQDLKTLLIKEILTMKQLYDISEEMFYDFQKLKKLNRYTKSTIQAKSYLDTNQQESLMLNKKFTQIVKGSKKKRVASEIVKHHINYHMNQFQKLKDKSEIYNQRLKKQIIELEGKTNTLKHPKVRSEFLEYNKLKTRKIPLDKPLPVQNFYKGQNHVKVLVRELLERSQHLKQEKPKISFLKYNQLFYGLIQKLFNQQPLSPTHLKYIEHVLLP